MIALEMAASVIPFQGQKCFDRAADDLTAPRPVIILHLFDRDTSLADPDASLQAGLAATAVTGQDFYSIQGRDDAALRPAGIEGFVPLERAIGLDQHSFQAFLLGCMVRPPYRLEGSGPVLEGLFMPAVEDRGLESVFVT
jgi:hypothetical protein